MEIENSLLTKIIFRKYKLIYLIGKGQFGDVYLGLNIQNKKLYAIKTENKSSSKPLLKAEAYILFNIRGPGIPSVITYGQSGQYNILVETLLGKSLDKIWIENNKKLNIKDICMIAIQTLERIEYIHSKDYIHRDIKPANFVVGYPDSSLIYIIDFGNSRKYRSSRTGKHIQSYKTYKIFGTILYLSIGVLRGNEQSRKDDLESLGYMYIYLATAELPWSKIKVNSLEEMLQKTSELKENTSIEELCKNMPLEMALYMKYVKKLAFDEDPNYDYLRSLFIKVLSKMGETNDNIFSWVDKSKIEKRNIIKSSSRNNTHSRLLKKIDKSLQKINKKKKIISSNNIVNKFRQFTNKEENEENNAYKTIKTDTNNKKIFNNIRRSRNLKNNNRIDNHVLKALNEKIKKITFQEKTYLIKKKTKNIYNENIINPTVFNINKSQKIFNNKKNKYLSKGNLNNSHTIDKIQNDFNDLIFDINYKKRTFVNNNQKKQILKMSILKNYSVKSKTKLNKKNITNSNQK